MYTLGKWQYFIMEKLINNSIYLKKKNPDIDIHRKFINNTNGFNFDQQIRIQFADQKMEITEIPIKTFYGTERSYFHLIYSSRFIFELIMYALVKLKLYKSKRF